MPGCVWCEEGGYWECDGEGGQGQCGKPDRNDTPAVEGAPPDWTIWRADCALTYWSTTVKKPVVDKQGKQVYVDIEAAWPEVVLNGRVKVGPGNPKPNCGSKPPHSYPGRKWKTNKVVPLLDKDGKAVYDPDDKQIHVRVQAYQYAKGPEHDPGHPPGMGPKVKVYAVHGPDDCT